MKRGISFGHILAATAAAALLAGPIVAQARDHDRDHDRQSRHDERKWRDGHERRARHHVERHGHRVYVREHHRNDRWDDRRDERRAYAAGYRQGRYDAGRYYRPAGYRYYAWHRGARLPAAYYAPRYVVRNYDHYRLYRPPHGHHWVRVEHDVVLAAVATGAVVAVVHNLFH